MVVVISVSQIWQRLRSPSGLAENSGNVWRRIILTRGRTENSGGAVFALAVFALAVFAPAVFSGREQRTEFLAEMLIRTS